MNSRWKKKCHLTQHRPGLVLYRSIRSRSKARHGRKRAGPRYPSACITPWSRIPGLHTRVHTTFLLRSDSDPTRRTAQPRNRPSGKATVDGHVRVPACRGVNFQRPAGRADYAIEKVGAPTPPWRSAKFVAGPASVRSDYRTRNQIRLHPRGVTCPDSLIFNDDLVMIKPRDRPLAKHRSPGWGLTR